MKPTSIQNLAVLATGLLLGLSAPLLADDEDQSVRYLVTVADDFVVDVYYDGKVVPDESRHLLAETFGATTERIDVPVHQGDWIVFHVVNDRMRWGGVSYFAAAGLQDENKFVFVSKISSADWSACDDPSSADRFIAEKNFLSDRPAREIAKPWGDGDRLMKKYAGDSWFGEPLWGRASDTWIKYIVP